MKKKIGLSNRLFLIGMAGMILMFIAAFFIMKAGENRFNFKQYLASVEAEDVEINSEELDGMSSHTLYCKRDGVVYCISTDNWGGDEFYSKLAIEKDGILYGIPYVPCDREMVDPRNGFVCGENILNVFMAITDDSLCEHYHGNVAGDCPLRNLGIAHYSIDECGNVSWHEDAGNPRSDLEFKIPQ